MKTFLPLVAAVSCAVGADLASASLLVNGSFEAPLGAEWSASGFLGRVGPAPNFTASDGSFGMLFNGGDTTPNGVLSQTFATTPNSEYFLSFDFGKWSAGPGVAALRVEALSGGATALDQTVSDGTGAIHLEAWSSFQFQFIATGTATTLRFSDVSNGTMSFDAILDNVVVVPTPGAALVPLLGVACLARRARRR